MQLNEQLSNLSLSIKKKPCSLFHNKYREIVNLKSNTMKNTMQI